MKDDNDIKFFANVFMGIVFIIIIVVGVKIFKMFF